MIAHVSFTADRFGRGTVLLDLDGSAHRVPYRYRPLSGLAGREAAYAALSAAAEHLARRGISGATITVDDDRIVSELRGEARLPAPLVMPYVQLRCRLNALGSGAVELAVSAGPARRSGVPKAA